MVKIFIFLSHRITRNVTTWPIATNYQKTWMARILNLPLTEKSGKTEPQTRRIRFAICA